MSLLAPNAEWPLVRLEAIVIDGPTNGYSPASAPNAKGTRSLKLSATTQGRLVLNEETIKYLHETVSPESSVWLEPGDLLVQRSNTADLVGTAAIYDGPPRLYIYPDLMMRLRFADEATTRWVWRYMNSPSGRRFFQSVAAGAAGSMPKISGAKLRAMPIPLPPLPEQRRIADILDKADAIRRKRKEAIALTEELLRSAFLEMFGDPVTNPKGWPVTPLTDLCESKQYGTAEKANSDGHGMPVLRMNNLTYGGELDLTSLKWVNLTREEAAKLDLRDGDVLFNRVNSHELVGKTAVWHGGEGYTFAGYLIRLRIRSTAATGDFVSSAMNMPSMKRTLMTMAKPSINMANISGSDLARVLIPVPPLDLQRKYDGLKRAMTKMRSAYRQSVDDGDVLFDSLVHRAFSGGLGVSEAKAGQLRLFPR